MTVETTNALFHDAARRQHTDRPPVWLMRQAGRFDPAYGAIRERCGLTLEELFRTPDLAAQITLLPRRFGVDALILFQDILTLPGPMGAPFVFRPGPELERPIRGQRDVQRLREFEPADELRFVAESIRLVKAEIGDEMPLLGFAGAPLTVAAFMIEGRSPRPHLRRVRSLMRNDPRAMHRLLGRLAKMTAAYGRLQLDEGVDGFQLFESIGDQLTVAEYREFALPYQARVFERLGPRVPRILFSREQPDLEVMIESGADVLSVGSCVDLAAAQARYGDRVAFQGNVCNQLLRTGTREEIEGAVRACIRAGGGRGHILNLSHGVLKDTPPDHVKWLIDACRASGGSKPEASGEGA